MSALRNAITKTRRMSLQNILPSIRLIGRRRSSTPKDTNDNTEEDHPDEGLLLEPVTMLESHAIDVLDLNNDLVDVSSGDRFIDNIDEHSNESVNGSVDSIEIRDEVPKLSPFPSRWSPSNPSEQQRRNFVARRTADSVHRGPDFRSDTWDPVGKVKSYSSSSPMVMVEECSPDETSDDIPSRRRSSIARLVGRLLNPRSGRRPSNE